MISDEQVRRVIQENHKLYYALYRLVSELQCIEKMSFPSLDNAIDTLDKYKGLNE